jgi:hypothetical protein
VIDDAFVAIEQLDKRLARVRIDEAGWIEGLDDALGRRPVAYPKIVLRCGLAASVVELFAPRVPM